jgi:hypothetical protein
MTRAAARKSSTMVREDATRIRRMMQDEPYESRPFKLHSVHSSEGSRNIHHLPVTSLSRDPNGLASTTNTRLSTATSTFPTTSTLLSTKIFYLAFHPFLKQPTDLRTSSYPSLLEYLTIFNLTSTSPAINDLQYLPHDPPTSTSLRPHSLSTNHLPHDCEPLDIDHPDVLLIRLPLSTTDLSESSRVFLSHLPTSVLAPGRETH